MPKSKNQKIKDLEELTGKLKTAKSVVLSEYRGTSVKDLDKFRNALRKEKVFSKVYKITLIRKALQACGIDASRVDYKIPVILSASDDDETTPARVIKSLAKELKTIGILQGITDGRLVSKAQVLVLVDLPSKDQLRAQVIAAINAPVSGFVNVLAGNIRGLINALNAVAQKA